MEVLSAFAAFVVFSHGRTRIKIPPHMQSHAYLLRVLTTRVCGDGDLEDVCQGLEAVSCALSRGASEN